MKKIFTTLMLTLLIPAVIKAELPSLTTVWDLSVNNGNTKPSYMSSPNAQRSMAVKNGKIYITDNTAGSTILVVDAETGSLEKTLTLSFLPTTSWKKNCIRFTDDGYVVVGSTGTGSNNFFFTIFSLENESFIPISIETSNTSGFGRTDYFSVYGNLYGTDADGGYIAVASNTGNITAIPMFGGTISKQAEAYFFSALFTGALSTMPVQKDANSFFVLGRNIQSGLYYKDGTKEMIPLSLIPTGTNSGGSYFEYNGRKYLVLATDDISAFKILDVTDGVSNVAVAMEGNFALGTTSNAVSTAITTIETEVREDGTMIYVMSSSNGIAAYKFVTEQPVTQQVATPVITPEPGEYEEGMSVTISTETPGATIRYTLDGTDPTETSAEYTDPIDLTTLGEVTVKANAWLADWTTSEVAQATYTIISATVGIEQGEASALKVYSANGKIVVEAGVATDVKIYNLQGQICISDNAVTGMSEYMLEKGIYIVKIGHKSVKIVL